MKNTIRYFSLVLALFTVLTFAACDAANEDYLMDESGFKGEADADSPSFSVGESSDGNISGSEVKPLSPGENADMDVLPPMAEETDTEREEIPEYNAGSEELPFIKDLILNPFIRVQENNFSTFSADVDTASYTYFRKLVSSGYSFNDLRNSGSAFRTEEFINYFKYDIPEAQNGELFGMYTELVPCPWDEESLIFRMTLEAPTAPESQGNNLVFLIDVSGSMTSDDKLPLLKQAFSYLVSNLSPRDTVSIVTYSGYETVVLDGARGGETLKILHAINSLSASGATNGEAGLTMAYRLAEKHFIDGGNNRIIMAGDGDLNVGISTADELTAYIEEMRDAGVYLSVLGFGTGNYRDNKMEALADNGNGVYYYIDGLSEAERVFGTELSGTLYTVAKDVKLQIEFNKDAVEEYRLIGYDNRVLDKADFENDTKDAGEVGASHQVTVLYEIKLKTNDLDTGIDPEHDPSCLMTFRVRYKNPDESASRLNEYVIKTSDVYRAEPTEQTAFILSVAKTAALLRNSGYYGSITVSSIFAELEQMELSSREMSEFRDIIKSLVE